MYVDVLVPGIWWHPLTYSTPQIVETGCRVVVPMGPRGGKRVGFVLAVKEKLDEKPSYEIKEVMEVLDQVPPLNEELWSLSEWISRQYLCSQSEALRLMCPPQVTKGCNVDHQDLSRQKPSRGTYQERCFYEASDEKRYARYVDIIEEAGYGLVFFPEETVARSFWDILPCHIKKKGLLWPSGGGKKGFDAWLKTRRGEVSVIVGSAGLLFAPLAPIDFILIEEEASSSYNFARYPYISLRHIAAKRAQTWGATLIFGGRMPSSRVYLLKKPQLEEKPRGQIHFVNIRKASCLELPGVARGIPISSTLLTSSLDAVNSGKIALWILDRKGYVGEISCEECGWMMTCPECGSLCRLTRDIVVCPICGKRYEMPTVCPSCMSNFIMGRRPGIEALYRIARSLVDPAIPVHTWYKEESGKKRRTMVLNDLKDGGIIVGSRLSVTFCDDCFVGVVGWVDADAEARRPLYDARFTAFSMIWESRCRGKDPDSRNVIVQSRTPYRGWQRGLRRGWHLFWDEELAERRELGFPPFELLVEITGPLKITDDILPSLDKSGFAVYKPIADEGRLWVKTKDLKNMREALKPFFHISRSKVGFPKIRIWRD